MRRHITQFISLSLAILMLGATAPVSAAEIAAPANIGSVSAVGSVQLRGVRVSEGTLFSGDRLNVAPGAYAKVVLGAGPKVEVGQVGGSSDITVSRDADAVNIQMKSGNVAFTANGQKPVHVRVGVYEVTASGQSRASVAMVGSSAFGVRVMDGSVTIRNTATRQSHTVQKGNERLISLSDSNPAGVQIASSAPTAIPAPPSMPARQGLSSGGKTALFVAAVVGSAAAIAILMTKNDDSDADAAKRLEQTKIANNLAAVEATTTAVVANNTAIASTATTASAAINASTTLSAAEKAAAVAEANAIASAAAASSVKLSALQAQISTLKAQLASGSGSQVQLQNLLNQEEIERQNSNALAAQLNALLSKYKSTTGVPQNSVGTIGPPNQSSASVPEDNTSAFVAR